MKTWSISVLLLTAWLGLLADTATNDRYENNNNAFSWTANRQKIPQGRRASDSSRLLLKHDASSINSSRNNAAAPSVSSSENTPPHRSWTLSRLPRAEDKYEIKQTDSVVGYDNKARSPTRSPWVVVPRLLTRQVAISHTNSSTLVRPASHNNLNQTVTLVLGKFEVSIKSSVDEDLYYEWAVIHVYRVGIRKSAQIYLKETLNFGKLLEIQLYSLERRSRNLLDIEETFCFGGEAVFQDRGPDPSELLEAQQVALNDTEAFQFYIRNADASLENVELIQAVILPNEELATDNSGRKKVSLIAVVAVTSGISLVFLLLQIAMICKLSRCQRNPQPPTSTTTITAKSP